MILNLSTPIRSERPLGLSLAAARSIFCGQAILIRFRHRLRRLTKRTANLCAAAVDLNGDLFPVQFGARRQLALAPKFDLVLPQCQQALRHTVERFDAPLSHSAARHPAEALASPTAAADKSPLDAIFGFANPASSPCQSRTDSVPGKVLAHRLARPHQTVSAWERSTAKSPTPPNRQAVELESVDSCLVARETDSSCDFVWQPLRSRGVS